MKNQNDGYLLGEGGDGEGTAEVLAVLYFLTWVLPTFVFALWLFLELYLSCIYSEMYVHHLKMFVTNSNPELEFAASFQSEVGGQGTACPGQATGFPLPEAPFTQLWRPLASIWPWASHLPRSVLAFILAVFKCFSFQFTFVSDANTLCQIPSRSNPCYYGFHCWEAFLMCKFRFS